MDARIYSLWHKMQFREESVSNESTKILNLDINFETLTKQPVLLTQGIC